MDTSTACQAFCKGTNYAAYWTAGTHGRQPGTCRCYVNCTDYGIEEHGYSNQVWQAAEEGVCSDDCAEPSSDCQDGWTGSAGVNKCPYGTDCTNCGLRRGSASYREAACFSMCSNAGFCCGEDKTLASLSITGQRAPNCVQGCRAGMEVESLEECKLKCDDMATSPVHPYDANCPFESVGGACDAGPRAYVDCYQGCDAAFGEPKMDTQCNNVCNTSYNGICEDGGGEDLPDGSRLHSCAYASDCSDCTERTDETFCSVYGVECSDGQFCNYESGSYGTCEPCEDFADCFLNNVPQAVSDCNSRCCKRLQCVPVSVAAIDGTSCSRDDDCSADPLSGLLSYSPTSHCRCRNGARVSGSCYKFSAERHDLMVSMQGFKQCLSENKCRNWDQKNFGLSCLEQHCSYNLAAYVCDNTTISMIQDGMPRDVIQAIQDCNGCEKAREACREGKCTTYVTEAQLTTSTAAYVCKIHLVAAIIVMLHLIGVCSLSPFLI